MPDLSDADKVAFARASLAFYAGWVRKTNLPDVTAGFAVPQPHHLEMINRMEDMTDIILKKPGWQKAGKERNTVIVAPPGAAKSLTLQAWYEWIIGQASIYWGDGWADQLHIAHLSHSADQAWLMSFAVRETIESDEKFKACFPNVKPSAKWAEKSWRVAGCTGIHPTFSAMGVDGSLSGLRLNLLGLDDLWAAGSEVWEDAAEGVSGEAAWIEIGQRRFWTPSRTRYCSFSLC